MNELTRITAKQHDMLYWVVKGPEGAVQVAFAQQPPTQWQTLDDGTFPGGWTGRDLGVHSPTSFRSDEAMHDDCPFLPGLCFYAGSSVPAFDLVRQWAAAGYDDEVIWRAAELHYRAVFIDGIIVEAETEEMLARLLDDQDGS
ncbi:hypothetical protein ACIA8R_29950 [Nonomuraea sp. NPDC051191]|uniref:hypothetical protein n=1 Tax=Nonomuraea sp. NPDC051191 TaxID=3364372 RepID=UPI0037B74654